jgi:hypothetical protein
MAMPSFLKRSQGAGSKYDGRPDAQRGNGGEGLHHSDLYVTHEHRDFYLYTTQKREIFLFFGTNKRSLLPF